MTIDRDYRDNGHAPLYEQYDGQMQPQRAYVEMDETGTVRVDYSGEIGYAVPMSVYHVRTLRWSVPPTLSVHGIDALLDEIAPLLARVHAGHTVEWDGSNHSGRLTTDARAAYAEIDRTIDRGDFDHAEVYDACEWASADWDTIISEYRDSADKRAYLRSLEAIAESDGFVLVSVDRLERAIDEELVTA